MTRTRAITTAKSAVTWILVTSGKQAQIYSRRKITKPGCMHADALCNPFEEMITTEPVPVMGMRWQAAPSNPQDDPRVSIIFNGRNPQDADEREAEMAEFAKTIAVQLNRAGNKRSFHRLVLIGSAIMIEQIKQHLNAKTRGRVVAEMPNDIVRYRSYGTDRATK